MTIIKKFEPEQPKGRFPKKCIISAVLGLFVLTILEIWANNTMVSYGEKFEKLAVLERKLTIENQILKNKIAKQSSLDNISSESAKLGFSEIQSIQYIR